MGGADKVGGRKYASVCFYALVSFKNLSSGRNPCDSKSSSTSIFTTGYICSIRQSLLHIFPYHLNPMYTHTPVQYHLGCKKKKNKRRLVEIFKDRIVQP